MKIKHILYSLAALMITASGCTYDNFEPPKAYLTGRVVHQNEPIGVRNNGVRLELYQRGFALYNKIDLHVAQDGSFSANVFDGDYQITRLRGNGPWVDQNDTIRVQVRGNTVVEVPVDPYFVIKNPQIQKGATSIDATFNLQRVNTSRNLERVNLYLNGTTIVDANIQTVNAQKLAADVNISQPITLNVNISP
jgi:type 1 fimbria pilin